MYSTIREISRDDSDSARHDRAEGTRHGLTHPPRIIAATAEGAALCSCLHCLEGEAHSDSMAIQKVILDNFRFVPTWT